MLLDCPYCARLRFSEQRKTLVNSFPAESTSLEKLFIWMPPASFLNVPFEVVNEHIFKNFVVRHKKILPHSSIESSSTSLHLEFFRTGSLSLWILLQKLKAIPPLHFMNIRQKAACTELASKCGNLKILEYCHSTYGWPVGKNEVRAAIIAGRTDVILWLHEANADLNKLDVFQIAAEAGRLDVLQWANSQGWNARRDVDYAILAKKCANSEVVKFILKIHPLKNDYEFMQIVESAIERDDLELLKYLNRDASIVNSSKSHYIMNYCEIAAKFGKLDILLWMREIGCHWSSSILTIADRYKYQSNENLELWNYVKDHGPPWN